MKRWKAWLLAAIMTITMMPTMAFADANSVASTGSDKSESATPATTEAVDAAESETKAQNNAKSAVSETKGIEKKTTKAGASNNSAQTQEIPDQIEDEHMGIRTNLNLKYGGEESVIDPNGSLYGDYSCKSSNSKVASVDEDGWVTARSVGTCDITVTFNDGHQAVCHVKVSTTGLKYKSRTIRVKTTCTNGLKGLASGAKWATSNKKIAIVNSKGVITGKKKGSCKVYATYDGKTYTCTVKVLNPGLSKTKKTVYNSDKYRLKVLGGSGKIKWKSSNKKVATVSKKGVVKGKKGGKCTITATRNGIKMKCRITVPKHYEGYSVPDFGALYGKTGKFSYGDSIAVAYKASKKSYNGYLRKLKKKGFAFVQKSSGVRLYMKDNGDVVAVVYKKGRVGIAFSNMWED